MGINYARLLSLTAREIVSALIRDGFVLDRQSGSLRLYFHTDQADDFWCWWWGSNPHGQPTITEQFKPNDNVTRSLMA